VIDEFEKLTSKIRIDAACFGIAGPVIEGQCRTTNLPWEITTVQLQSHLKSKNVRLLNDLEATAYGMLYLGEDEFLDLNPMGEAINGNRAVIAAGTGLGEAMLFWDGRHYHPIASEGGHTDFAPSTPQQDNLLKWLRHRYGGHVSFERILSGPGLYTLYEFLAESGFAPQPTWMLTLSDGADRSARVSQGALIDNDPLCVEALRLFVEIYGAESGNLALKTMSLGGVYIGGGIAPKILSAMSNDTFMNAFVNKGRFEPLLRNMEVKISLNPQAALLGAAHFAVDRSKSADG
jgi:glucokinase